MNGSKLVETDLYLGDNGRVFCGRLRHAGMTAHFSGRDLSGQKVERLTPAAAAWRARADAPSTLTVRNSVNGSELLSLMT